VPKVVFGPYRLWHSDVAISLPAFGWNSLPNDVVEAETINTFKNRLDKHWSNQDVLFNFHADITVIGSLPICM